MRSDTIPALFSIVAAAAIIIMWIVFIAADQVKELSEASVSISFHIAAEGFTSLALLAGGIGLLLKKPWAIKIHALSLGMLFYAVVQAFGYFADDYRWPMMVLFAVMIFLTALFIAKLFIKFH